MKFALLFYLKINLYIYTSAYIQNILKNEVTNSNKLRFKGDYLTNHNMIYTLRLIGTKIKDKI